MAPVKCDQVILAAHEIQIRAHHFLKADLFVIGIADHSTSGDDIKFRDHPVQKRHFHKTRCVSQKDFQCLSLTLSGVYCRQALESVFAVPDRITRKAQVASLDSVSVLHDQGCASHVARSRHRKFLGKDVKRIGAVITAVVKLGRISSIRICKQVLHRAFASAPVVEMEEDTVFVRFHLICRIYCMYCKQTSVLRNYNRHYFSFSLYSKKTLLYLVIIIIENRNHL